MSAKAPAAFRSFAQGFAQAFARIGSPAAVSWPTFWVSLGFNFFLAFAGSFDEVAAWQRLVVVAASQATMFALLLACRATVLRDAASRPRPWAALACFLAAGITRNVTAGAVFAAFLGPDAFRPGLRIVSGAIVGIVAFVPTTIIVASWRDYRQRRADLLARRASLMTTAVSLQTDIAARDQSVLDQVRAQLDDVLAVSDPAPELQRWSSDVLRPMSHQLALAIPQWQPSAVAPERVRVIDVLRQAVRGAPFMPVTTSVTVALLAFIPIFLAYGWGVALMFTAGLLIVGSALLWAANRLLAGLFPLPTAARGILMLVLLGVIGLVVGLLAEALLPTEEVTFLVAPALGLGFLFFGLGFALARSLARELRRTLEELEEADARLAWRVARLGLTQWAQGSRFARALHGPVQGLVTVAIARLRESPHEAERILADLRWSLLQALEGGDHGLAWRDGVERVTSAWSGFCDVRLTAQGSCQAVLDADEVCRDMALEILAEAVSNAVRHGGATRVTADVSCAGDRVIIVLTDNGAWAPESTGGLPGLGTRVLDACTLEWSRERVPGATRVRAVLPALVAVPAVAAC